jgi:arginine N-succinyltransferase
MFIVREVHPNDLESLWQLVGQANVGMTSLNIDKEQLADRIERSRFAFQRSTEKAEGAPYVFVMQDLASHALIGTSCIFSKTGGYEPFYAYRVESEIKRSETLQLSYEMRSLHLVKIHDGPTEIGSLFLLPEYRGKGCGKLLSLSRFAYMAQHPKRFAKQTIAEMRGFLDAENTSPFWDAIGAKFFKTDFPHADSLSMIDKQFIEDLMPIYPIYLDLLPEAAVTAIGRVHEQTYPALGMLEAQGFRRNQMIDIFDGGPVVQCATQEIVAIKNSRLLELVPHASMDASRPTVSKKPAVVATTSAPFVAALVDLAVEGEQAAIEASMLDILPVRVGELVRVLF